MKVGSDRLKISTDTRKVWEGKGREELSPCGGMTPCIGIMARVFSRRRDKLQRYFAGLARLPLSDTLSLFHFSLGGR